MSLYLNLKQQQSHACGCIGPQNGEPLCPCRMRNVQVKDGRYVETIDHGPVSLLSKEEWRQLRSILTAKQ